MLINKTKNSYLNFRNFNFVLHNPSILKTIVHGKSKGEIIAVARRLKELQDEKIGLRESFKFISSMKKRSPYYLNRNYEPKLNRLCYLEDWDNTEFKTIVNELQNSVYESYIQRKDWSNKIIYGRNRRGVIHRKDWEWALGIIAMKRLGKLNKNSKALGRICS